ncbi:hypothetical protein C8Q70DRAFT_517391 [Cubamyces menziesii]|nr:hypothetical protein C8Q70DRAFT_517391 [Cubamyces menziesii]
MCPNPTTPIASPPSHTLTQTAQLPPLCLPIPQPSYDDSQSTHYPPYASPNGLFAQDRYSPPDLDTSHLPPLPFGFGHREQPMLDFTHPIQGEGRYSSSHAHQSTTPSPPLPPRFSVEESLHFASNHGFVSSPAPVTRERFSESVPHPPRPLSISQMLAVDVQIEPLPPGAACDVPLPNPDGYTNMDGFHSSTLQGDTHTRASDEIQHHETPPDTRVLPMQTSPPHPHIDVHSPSPLHADMILDSPLPYTRTGHELVEDERDLSSQCGPREHVSERLHRDIPQTGMVPHYESHGPTARDGRVCVGHERVRLGSSRVSDDATMMVDEDNEIPDCTASHSVQRILAVPGDIGPNDRQSSPRAEHLGHTNLTDASRGPAPIAQSVRLHSSNTIAPVRFQGMEAMGIAINSAATPSSSSAATRTQPAPVRFQGLDVMEIEPSPAFTSSSPSAHLLRRCRPARTPMTGDKYFRPNSMLTALFQSRQDRQDRYLSLVHPGLRT